VLRRGLVRLLVDGDHPVQGRVTEREVGVGATGREADAGGDGLLESAIPDQGADLPVVPLVRLIGRQRLLLPRTGPRAPLCRTGGVPAATPDALLTGSAGFLTVSWRAPAGAGWPPPRARGRPAPDASRPGGDGAEPPGRVGGAVGGAAVAVHVVAHVPAGLGQLAGQGAFDPLGAEAVRSPSPSSPPPPRPPTPPPPARQRPGQRGLCHPPAPRRRQALRPGRAHPHRHAAPPRPAGRPRPVPADRPRRPRQHRPRRRHRRAAPPGGHLRPALKVMPPLGPSSAVVPVLPGSVADA
jgi:hypothetical protein